MTRSTSQSATGTVDFDASTLASEEDSSPFNLATDTFVPPVSGVYWLAFSAAIANSATADVKLIGLPSGNRPNVLQTVSGEDVCLTQLNVQYMICSLLFDFVWF